MFGFGLNSGEGPKCECDCLGFFLVRIKCMETMFSFCFELWIVWDRQALFFHSRSMYVCANARYTVWLYEACLSYDSNAPNG